MSDYLWDRSGPVDPDVEVLEQQLKPLAFDAKAHPFMAAAPSLPFRRRALASVLGALAACVLVAVGLVAWHSWRLNWQNGRGWAISGGGTLAVGSPLRVESAPATISIARLGVLDASPGTELELRATGPKRHRFSLSRGEINVRVWAPPGRLAVGTPAGDVIDLGCIFSLSVDSAGATRLSVHTGWVELDNAYGTSFVPAGASAGMTVDREPQVPVYDDASDAFRRAARAIEVNPDTAPLAILRTITGDARARDALTLLRLAGVDGMSPEKRAVLLDALARFYPPPTPEAISRIANGDRDLFWKWFDSLPLPPLKNWWANWRDVFPREMPAPG